MGLNIFSFPAQKKILYHVLCVYCLGLNADNSNKNSPTQPPSLSLSLLRGLPSTFDRAELQRCCSCRACGRFQLPNPPTWPPPPTHVSSGRRSASAVSQLPSRRGGHVSDHSPTSGAAPLSHSISKVAKGTFLKRSISLFNLAAFSMLWIRIVIPLQFLHETSRFCWLSDENSIMYLNLSLCSLNFRFLMLRWITISILFYFPIQTILGRGFELGMLLTDLSYDPLTFVINFWFFFQEQEMDIKRALICCWKDLFFN